ncbi:MAG: FkbM family methyltransferase, partial [Proteobacteria bacterium]|nr:FkbM family methyltransferase [Pseudomonadota bacterium]
TIEVRTLDSLALQEPISFIKMDVEDNELSVLKGGQETLKRSGYPPILFESNHANTTLFEFLKGLGYGIVPIRGISNMFLATA